MNLRILAAAALAALLLSACATAPRAVTDPVARAAFADAQAAREQALATDRTWSLSGRIAVSNDGRGGSGRIDWQQDGDDYVVSLGAPVTRQSWRLSGGPGHARLEGLEGGAREGPDARALLWSATGWDIPFDALADWVRGARAQAAGPARIEFGPRGLPISIAQDGWRIGYEWADPAGEPSSLPLPERIEATRGEAKVRLIVDGWGDAPR